MSHWRVRVTAAAIVVAISLALSQPWVGEENAPQGARNSEATWRQGTLPRSAPDACTVLTARLARGYLGRIVARPRVSRGPSGRLCTYLSRDLDRSVSVGIYPARGYDRAVASMRRARRDQVAGSPAAFNDRFGYVIRLNTRPFYLQATFQHVEHLHADRDMSRRLASSVLASAPAPGGEFVCSLTGKRAA